jgi:uncharacterized repeat protein (TIGR03803 family)
MADPNGNLFGTTSRGGAHEGGTVFEIVKSAGGYSRAPTTLVSFCTLGNCTDGVSPRASLTADTNGNLFGTTSGGGAHEGGTVFEIVKIADGYANTPKTLVSFCALTNCADGAGLVTGLIVDAKDNLFGTTLGGGAHNHKGTVFEIVKTAGHYTSTPKTLLSFCALPNCADGASPHASLIADATGNLFGATFFGGSNYLFAGAVFEIIKSSGRYATAPTTLVSFCAMGDEPCLDGENPAAKLVLDAYGNLFGTTLGGGEHDGGTVFEIARTVGGYASIPEVLVSFCALPNCADGASPHASLIVDADGNLFGTTSLGGTGNNGGTVFEIANTVGGYASSPKTLVSFCTLANCADGADPQADLITDANGNLFGTTRVGGANSSGTVFEITGGGFVVPVGFTGTPGKPNCWANSVSALARQYGGLNAAAAALDYSGVQVLQNAIATFCAG